MGTRGLPRLAVDGAPDGMGMGMVMGLHSCVWGVVRSGQVRSGQHTVHLYVWEKAFHGPSEELKTSQ